MNNDFLKYGSFALVALGSVYLVTRLLGKGFSSLGDEVISDLGFIRDRVNIALSPNVELTGAAEAAAADYIRIGYAFRDGNGVLKLTPKGEQYVAEQKLFELGGVR